MSIAMEVCRMVEARLGSDGAATVVEVGLEVGDDAGVEPANLEFCLEALLTQPPFRQARAVLARAPGDVLRLSYMEVDDGRPDDLGP